MNSMQRRVTSTTLSSGSIATTSLVAQSMQNMSPANSSGRGAGWPTVPAEKAIDPGINELRKRLQADGNLEIAQHKTIPSSWRIGNETQVRNRPDAVGLLVPTRCEHLIREFLGYKVDHVGSAVAVTALTPQSMLYERCESASSTGIPFRSTSSVARL